MSLIDNFSDNPFLLPLAISVIPAMFDNKTSNDKKEDEKEKNSDNLDIKSDN